MTKKTFVDFKDAEKERQQPAKKVNKNNETKGNLRSLGKERISAYVSSELYKDFTNINNKLGFSNSSILNMLIHDYVNDKNDKSEN